MEAHMLKDKAAIITGASYGMGQTTAEWKVIENQTFDAERALYGSRDLLVKDCSFDGRPMARAPSRSAATCR